MSRPVVSLASSSLQLRLSAPESDTFPGKNYGEIDVFPAKKYFREGLDCCNEAGRKRVVSFRCQNDVFAEKQPVTPSVVSGSSRSSGCTLLRSHEQRKPDKMKVLAAVLCSCSCSGKNSVAVAENPANGDEEDGSVLKQAGKNKARDPFVRKTEADYGNAGFENPIRHFRLPEGGAGRRAPPLRVWSPIPEYGRNSLRLDRKSAAMMPWEARREIRFPPVSAELHYESDSDTSSDLFEIDSLSKGNPFLFLPEPDEFSGSATPRNCYAPSEASIEWSVVTASTADFDDAAAATKRAVKLNPKISSGNPKRRPGILHGCRSQKAVGVVGDAHENRFSKLQRAQSLRIPPRE